MTSLGDEYHFPLPKDKLGKNELKPKMREGFTVQKSKKLGEQEWDLTSFETEPKPAPAKQRKGGKQLTK